jgi:hypothetical protein
MAPAKKARRKAMKRPAKRTMSAAHKKGRSRKVDDECRR